MNFFSYFKNHNIYLKTQIYLYWFGLKEVFSENPTK